MLLWWVERHMYKFIGSLTRQIGTLMSIDDIAELKGKVVVPSPVETLNLVLMMLVTPRSKRQLIFLSKQRPDRHQYDFRVLILCEKYASPDFLLISGDGHNSIII